MDLPPPPPHVQQIISEPSDSFARRPTDAERQLAQAERANELAAEANEIARDQKWSGLLGVVGGLASAAFAGWAALAASRAAKASEQSVLFAKLEQVCGQSLVFKAFGRMTETETPGQGALASAVDATAKASRSLQVIHAAKADGVLCDSEIEDVRDAARENLEAAQRQFDETMRLRPTLKVVA